MTKKPDRSSRVPTGRIERLARLGWMTGEFALSGAAKGVVRALGGADEGSTFLSPASAERLANHLSRMRGAAMKVGQMISLIDDSILPPEFSDALAILRQSGDMMPEAQVRKSLEREYGQVWEPRFREFDFEPIAAASIGQVHMAVAADGRELALKIQYPGVAESIDSDVDNLAMALSAARILPGEFDFAPIVVEAKRQLRQEADYVTEAAFLRRYHALVAGDPHFVVPGVVDELTTERVLAMERLHGLPLEDLASPEHPQERRDRMASLLIELLFRELFEFGIMQTDPNFSNYLLLEDKETMGLLDFGSTREVPDDLANAYFDIFDALRRDDREALEDICRRMDYLRDDDPEDRRNAFLDLIEVIYEPFGHDGPYDFGASDFIRRAQEHGMRLAFGHGFLRTPPAETIFLQRKIDGTLMLCGRIKASVDVGAIFDRFAARRGAST